MANINAKIILPLVAVLVIAGGAAALLSGNSKDNQGKNASAKPGSAQVNEAQSNVSTATPKEIGSDPARFNKKIVSVSGTVLEVSPGNYYITALEEDKKSYTALKVDFKKSKIDPTKYSMKAAPTAEAAKDTRTSEPVKITGEVVFIQSTEPYIIVQSVD